MKRYRIRKLVQSQNKTIYGITLPTTISACFGERTIFSFEMSGTCIILKSGCEPPTKQEAKKFDLETIEIK